MRIMKGAVLTCMLIAIAVGTTQAQDLAGKLAIIPQIGVLIPTGDFAATDTLEAGGRAKLGCAFGSGFEYYVSENIAVGGKAMYNCFGVDTDDAQAAAPNVNIDASWTIIEVGGYLKYVFSSAAKTRMFGRAGVLFAKADQKITASESGASLDAETDIAMALGLEVALGGMHMLSKNTAFFGEVGFTHVMTDGKDVDITLLGQTYTGEAAINMQWFGVKAGLAFFLGGK